ncbi:MAG: aminotransferase class V-fold PLP-dependent enzyme [Chitinophagales bacterium]
MSIPSDLALFQSIVEKLLKEEKENPVAPYNDVAHLQKTLDLCPEKEAMSESDFATALEKLVLNTPRTGSQGFFNQLFGGRKSKAVLGDLLAVVLNNSMYTYKVGGPQIIVEKEIIRRVSELAGYGNESGGTFAPGGSMSNMMAMIMARDSADSNASNKGVHQKLIAYTSSESHYSIPKNAAFTGIGRDNVRYIEADKFGRMNPEVLATAIQEDIDAGNKPFFINATAGTTVLGAFDPIQEISAISKKHKVWLHVDGAFGAAVLFSEKYKHLISGIEHSDSFSLNAHKMLGTPLSCSMIFTKDKKKLYSSFSNKASYLYQTGDDDYNPGKTSLQCGRRNDALKFWTLWKALGDEGLEEIVEKEFELADYARDYVRSNSDYTLYSFDNSIAVCFNYKDYDPDKLCELLYENAELMVGYGIFKGEKFIRLVFVNSENSKEDIRNFFIKLEAFTEKNEVLLNDKSTVG